MTRSLPARSKPTDRPDAHCPDCPFADRGDWVMYRAEYEALTGENRRLREQLVRARAETVKWIQAFNSLEKPVTNHIERCIDADDLDRAHGVVMRRFGPNG